MEEEIIFSGHPNIRALHEMTIELTKAKEITLRADCVLGVNATKACADLSENFKTKLLDDNSIIIALIIGDHEYNLSASGSHSLILTDRNDIVIRKSDFVCPRTLAVKANNASNNIPRSLITLLKDPSTKGIMRIQIE